MAQRGRKKQLVSKTPPGPKPDPPTWLTDDGLELWLQYSDTINALGLLESLDAISFGLLCDAIATLHDMRQTFSRDGCYTHTVGENGALQVNPICQLIAQQTKAVLTLAAEFGMTPRGRVNLTGSLSCNPDPGAVNPMEQLLREVAGTGVTAATPDPQSSKAVSRKASKSAVPRKPRRKS